MTKEEYKDYIRNNEEFLDFIADLLATTFNNNKSIINLSRLDESPDNINFYFSFVDFKYDFKIFKGSFLNERLTNSINKPEFENDRLYSLNEISNNFINIKVEEEEVKKLKTLLKKQTLYATEQD